MQTKQHLRKGSEMKAHEMPWHSWNDDDYYVIDRKEDEIISQTGRKCVAYDRINDELRSNDDVFCGTGMDVKRQYLNKQ